MKIIINGVTLEDVTADEALKILALSKDKRQYDKTKTSAIGSIDRNDDNPSPRKTIRRSGNVRTKVYWTEKEIFYILANMDMKPLELAKTINRHSTRAIGIMKSVIKLKQFDGRAKYLKELTSKFYNQNRGGVDIPVTVAEKRYGESL